MIHVWFCCLDIHKEAIKKTLNKLYQSREQDVNKINDSRGMIMKTYRQFLDSMTTTKFIFWLSYQREVMFHSHIGSDMLFLLEHDVYIIDKYLDFTLFSFLFYAQYYWTLACMINYHMILYIMVWRKKISLHSQLPKILELNWLILPNDFNWAINDSNFSTSWTIK